MASSKTKAAPVGTAQWVQNERNNTTQLVSLDAEEFSFSVRNELEWLNDHMEDIFSKSQKSFADIFKTPSRMRGKTPRTTRKRVSMPTRQPLTDIFAPQAPVATPAVQAIDFQNQAISFPIPADDENTIAQHRPISRGKSPNRAGIPYVDSGYHGMTEDEMDVDAHAAGISQPSQTQEYSQPMPLHRTDVPTEQPKEGKADETGTSDESFVSAEEAVAAKRGTNPPPEVDPQGSDDATVPDEEIQSLRFETENIAGPVEESQSRNDTIHIDEDNRSQSDLSSPENPLQRKSSFAFSALPAREPLAAKRSMGTRTSQIDFQPARASTLSRSMGGKVSESEKQEEESVHPKPTEPELRSKTSTQLLHERITMLGKAKESILSKPTQQHGYPGQASYPQLPDVEIEAAMLARSISQTMRDSHRGSTTIADEDEDWIAPSSKPSEASSQTQLPVQSLSPERPGLHQKTISASTLPYASRSNAAGLTDTKLASISHPNLASSLQSTTPLGSPSTKKTTEGTISASKNRLWSALKSAKNIFASSASASAAAKLEAHNDSPVRFVSPKRDISNDSGTAAVLNMPGALYSERELPQSPVRPASAISMTPKRTRSSTENDRKREKEAKEQQKTANNLEKEREKERKKATKQRQDEMTRQEQVQPLETKPEEQQAAGSQNQESSIADSENTQVNGKPMSAFKSSILSSSKFRAPGRPVRPTRGTAQSKPAPVSIRVASQSQRMGQGQGSTPSLSKSQHESSATATASKQGSNSRPSSAQSNKSGPAAPVNARVKAYEAAARKKEADDRATQKRAEQKRELERKRAAKAEEERRAEEERKAAEQQRIQEARLAAQRKAEKLAEKQAAEARRREQERAEQQSREQERAEQQRREQERIEQLRQQEDARKAREAHELAERISRERAQQAQQSHTRGDVGGTIRQLIKNTIPQLNPAKPAKRHIQPEDEEQVQAPQRPGTQRGPPSYQQTDAKRRRTNEEQDEPEPRRSVMAPPKRPSNLRKETLSKFPHGYTHAPSTTGAVHGPSMFKAAVTAQHQLYHSAKGTAAHPSQMVQISNARIPFAENNNPPAAHHPATSQLYPGYENAHPSASANKFKTPGRPGQGPKSAKSSPLYQNGDHIALPEITTDSEEDSEDDGPTGFRAPSWVASPALREQLAQQQLVDPESVFGPIAELKMDEVFKGVKNPERLRKFRDRGSSALWVESGDAVTSAEKRRDMELRERVAREGGWRYEPGT